MPAGRILQAAWAGGVLLLLLLLLVVVARSAAAAAICCLGLRLLHVVAGDCVCSSGSCRSAYDDAAREQEPARAASPSTAACSGCATSG